MKIFFKALGAGLGLALFAGAVLAQQPYINATVGGELRPGVYGRIEIGNAPPPAVIYSQPVIISQPAVVVSAQQPVYMYVPPGHAKKWSKHCHEYNACGVPVYFLKMNGKAFKHKDWDDDDDDDDHHGGKHGHHGHRD